MVVLRCIRSSDYDRRVFPYGNTANDNVALLLLEMSSVSSPTDDISD